MGIIIALLAVALAVVAAELDLSAFHAASHACIWFPRATWGLHRAGIGRSIRGVDVRPVLRDLGLVLASAWVVTHYS